MANVNLTNAKIAKNDEFYTQFRDIEKEINAYLEYDPDVFRGKTVLCPCDDPYESNFFKYFALNFKDFGLKKLIATCYAGSPISNKELSLFDDESPENKTTRKAHKLILTDPPDFDGIEIVNLPNIKKILSDKYHVIPLSGNGDFRSDEIKALRDEADFIITNPPFSLFREFLAWVVEAKKKFVVIGNKNVITYKEVFPLIKENKMWVGTTSFNKDMLFISPDEIDPSKKPSTATRTVEGVVYLRSPSVWFTNIDHGRRHQKLQFMTMADNLRYSKHKEIKGKKAYDHYDNYDAIEVPYTDAIPSDYEGVMGVPISFLDKYSPEQFEIIWTTDRGGDGMLEDIRLPHSRYDAPVINEKGLYKRIFIKHKKAKK